MKKIILLALTALMMVGCGITNEKQINVKNGETILTIDSCEYIERAVYVGSVLVHKGNCRFCKERRQKEMEELIIKLKEK